MATSSSEVNLSLRMTWSCVAIRRMPLLRKVLVSCGPSAWTSPDSTYREETPARTRASTCASRNTPSTSGVEIVIRDSVVFSKRATPSINRRTFGPLWRVPRLATLEPPNRLAWIPSWTRTMYPLSSTLTVSPGETRSCSDTSDFVPDTPDNSAWPSMLDTTMALPSPSAETKKTSSIAPNSARRESMAFIRRLLQKLLDMSHDSTTRSCLKRFSSPEEFGCSYWVRAGR
jgi:hypothetical protein